MRKVFIAVIKSLEIKELSNAETMSNGSQAPQERQRRDDRVTEKRYVPPIIQEEFSEEENIAEVTAWVEDLNEVEWSLLKIASI